MVDRRAFHIHCPRGRKGTNQAIKIVRLEFVRVPRQRLKVSHSVVARTGSEDTMECERAQCRVAAGAATPNDESVAIRQPARHEVFTAAIQSSTSTIPQLPSRRSR